MEPITLTVLIVGGTFLVASNVYNHFRVAKLEQESHSKETVCTKCNTL